MSPIRHPDPSPVRSASGAPSAHGTTLTDVRIDSDSDAGVDIVTSTRGDAGGAAGDAGEDAMDELTRILAREIERLPAGHKIASEQQLMARFGVSRSAVRHAIAQLESRYLVRRAQGSGTYVHRRIDYTISDSQTPSLHRIIEAGGGRPRTFVVDHGTYPAPEHIAQLLDVETGAPIPRLERLAYIDDAPAMYLQEHVRPDAAEHLDVTLQVVGSLDQVLRHSGREPQRAWSRATLDTPPDEVATRLQIPADTQVWVVRSLLRDARTRVPLVTSRAYTRVDLVRMVFEFDAR